MAIFTIKDEDINNVNKKISEFEGDAERVINDYLTGEAGKKIIDAITPLIPISNSKYRITHARNSNPLESMQKNNLELVVKTKKNFNYLYFPQNAHGCKFVGKAPNDFMEKGINNIYDNLVDELLNRLQNKF